MDALVVVDFQEKLAKRIDGIEDILKNSEKLIKAFRIFNLPIIATEQMKLGNTVENIRRLIAEIITKSSFSCMRNEKFLNRIKELRVRRVALIGIEAHICVYQTAIDMIKSGIEVSVAVDCIGSRKKTDKDVAIIRMLQEGVKISSAEMIIYEILKTAEAKEFKEILEIIKE
ncbi:MAG: isochorismatase family protein [Archaeoglobales archaeon]|nr:isochorismatase family protein [Archaeoglobales archaeon]